MATFTSAQTTDLARIFTSNSDVMGDHLTFFADVISDEDKTAILADITAYEAVEDDNVFVTAGPAGFQGSISPDKKRSLIKNRIAGLIQWPLPSSGGARLVRS